MGFGFVVGIDNTGFLVILKNKVDIYEWDDNSESLVKTALVRKEALLGIAALGLSADDLICS